MTATKSSAYTAEDIDAVEYITRWLDDNKQSRAWLARKSTIPSGTISAILGLKYPSSPTRQLATMCAALNVESERISDGVMGYIEGSVHKLTTVVCDRTRKHANFGVLVGFVGVGKTFSLKEYQRRNPQTILIECDPSMTSTTLLCELLNILNVPMPLGLAQKFNAVIQALVGSTSLLLIDEADNLTPNALHYLRRIRDKARVGIVLSGTVKLNQMLKPESGQFDQVRSRVGMWPATIRCITRDDCDDMARSGLGELGELTDDVLDALWAYCAGSARVLMEGLVPSVREFCHGRPLSVALIDGVARDALSLKKRVIEA